MNAMAAERNRVVCFLGDSITANGGWIGYISAYFAAHGRRKTLFRNCGVSGTTAGCAIERLYSDCLCHNPDAVYISFGINDIGWNLYEREYREGCDLSDKKSAALDSYAVTMDRLVTLCLGYGTEPILLTPTAYDDVSDIDRPALTCNTGLEKCIQTLAEISGRHGVRLIDMFTPFRSRLAEGITLDRTHPNDAGDRIIAAALLRENGYDVTDSFLAGIAVTGTEKKRRETESILRSAGYVRWYMGMKSRTPEEAAENIARLYSEARSENAPGFMKKIADDYSSAVCGSQCLEGELVRLTREIYNGE